MRVTMDLDYPSEIKKLSSYFNMKHICGVDEIHVSAGGHGLHYIKRGLDITYEEALRQLD